MVSVGPIRECSRMIGKANGETPQFVNKLASPCVPSQKAKVFSRCMSRNREFRMTVPRSVAFFSSASSVAVIDLLPTSPCSPLPSSFQLATPIPRISSASKVDVALCFCVAYHEAGLPERRYRRRLVLVDIRRIQPSQISSNFCAIEASENLWGAMD